MSIEFSPSLTRRVANTASGKRTSKTPEKSYMPTYVTALLGSFIVALLVTPIVRRLAIRFGIVDRPDPHRKLHTTIVARAGGVGVLIATGFGCLCAFLPYYQLLTWNLLIPFLGIAAVMVGMCVLGLTDDVIQLRGRQKLVGQTLLASLLVVAGFHMNSVRLFGIDIQLGVLGVPATILWLLATTNAMNLIDGSDGLCSSVGAIITGSLGLMAVLSGNDAEAAVAFSMCGALIGFLVFNFPPASIFLGDSGSLLIGMISGALAIRCSMKGPTTAAMVAPLAILIIPLFDSAMAIVRRKMTGRSIYTTDRAHLHHSIKERGFSDVGLLLVAGSLSGFAALSAVGGAMLGSDWISGLGATGVLVILVSSRVFGFAELMLVIQKSRQLVQSMFQPVAKGEENIHQSAVRLQGTRNWETVWETLVDFAVQQGLSRVHMDLNVPWLHEGFHATWERARMPERSERWSTSLPIHSEGRIFGRLDLTGPVPAGRNFEVLNLLAHILEDLEPQIESLLNDASLPPALATLEVNLAPSRAS